MPKFGFIGSGEAPVPFLLAENEALIKNDRTGNAAPGKEFRDMAD